MNPNSGPTLQDKKYALNNGNSGAGGALGSSPRTTGGAGIIAQGPQSIPITQSKFVTKRLPNGGGGPIKLNPLP